MIEFTWHLIVYLVAACIGIILNSVLLVVLLKHSEIRTPESIPLINVCLADLACMLNPFIILLLGVESIGIDPHTACYIAVFNRSFVITVNVYSIASISIQRYACLFRLKNRLPEVRKSYQHSWFIAGGVWLIAVISATTVLVLEGRNFCRPQKPYVIPGDSTLRLIIYAVVPSVIMGMFYTLSDDKTRNSSELRSLEPNEVPQDRRRKITRILLALAIFLAVSKQSLIIISWILRYFVPFHHWSAHVFNLYLQYAYILNPIFNPIVLCLASSELRRLYNKYCCCCFFCCKETHGHIRSRVNQSNIDTTPQETELSRL